MKKTEKILWILFFNGMTMFMVGLIIKIYEVGGSYLIATTLIAHGLSAVCVWLTMRIWAQRGK